MVMFVGVTALFTMKVSNFIRDDWNDSSIWQLRLLELTYNNFVRYALDENDRTQFTRDCCTTSRNTRKILQKSGRRTSQAASKILKKFIWDKEHISAYERCKQELANQFMLEHRDFVKSLCLFTYACDDRWSDMVTKVPPQDLGLPFTEKIHAQLGFLSGRFSATQHNWSIFEKKAFSIMAIWGRMRCPLEDSAGFNLYTGHNYMQFIFDLLRYLPVLSVSFVRKVLRSAVALSWFNYVSYLISGNDNISADLIGRWTPPQTCGRLIRIPFFHILRMSILNGLHRMKL